MNNIVINLEDYRAIGEDGTIAKVFTGRDRGKQVRERSRIDELERTSAGITVIIPNNIHSINPSFFEELFFNVVTRLGKERFRQKFDFVTVGGYNYEKPLNEAISRILRNKTALD